MLLISKRLLDQPNRLMRQTKN